MLAVLAFAPPLAAQPVPGLDTWVDACEATDPDLARLLEAEAAMVAPGFLVGNLDGTYQLLDQPFDHIPASGGAARLCSDSRFFGQPRPDGYPAGRSAFLVGPDLVLTANHHLSPDVVPGHDFVFGLAHHVSPWGSCEPPDVERIPAADVYRAVEVVAHGGAELDFVLLRLDREVAGRTPLRVRRSGRGVAGDRVTVVGHPELLPTKVDLAATYAGITPERWPRIAGAHTLVGSSGSMVWNRERELVESAVWTFGCANYRYREIDACFELFSDCSAGPIPLGDALVDFAPEIPAFELVVDSLDDAIHVVASGAPLPAPDRTYEVAAPPTALGPIHYRITPPVPAPPGEPSLEISTLSRLEGVLPPGRSIKVDARAALEGATCGRFERSFVVEDLTHGWIDRPRHLFEIGLTEIVVEPAAGWTFSDLAPPYEEVADYEIVNVRPDPVTVEIATNRDWIELQALSFAPAGDGGPLTWTLGPAGEPGDRAGLRVTIGAAAAGLPSGVWHEGAVEFTNASDGCEALGSTARTVRFRPGFEEISSDDEEWLPIPDGAPGGLERKLETSEAFCVADVDLAVRTTGQHAGQLTVELLSPDSTVVRVWDRSLPDPVDLRRWFDDEDAPPPTGESMSLFDGGTGGGTWTLRVVDGEPGGENQLASWTLRLTAAGAPPCAPAR
jgi:hypothetical protein